MNLDATSAPHHSDETPAAPSGPGSSTLTPHADETTTAAPAQASFPASSPGAATSHSPAQASFPLASTASVPTQRAARYGKQLVSHMAHKITGAWDEETASGYLLFDREGPVLGRVDVIASPSDLRLELRTTPERAAHLEHVAGIHLARFGARPRARQAQGCGPVTRLRGRPCEAAGHRGCSLHIRRARHRPCWAAGR